MGFLNLLINFIQPIIKIIQPIVSGIKAIIEQAQTYSQQGTSGSSSSSDSSSASEASRPRGPSPEEIYQMEQAQQAADFDNDIARVTPNDALLDEEDTLPIPSRTLTELKGDIAQLLQGDPTPAELLVAAAGNPVAQALLQMLRHERPHLELVMQMAPSIQKGIVLLLGLAEEDTVDTAEATQICTQALSVQAQVYDPTQMIPEEVIWMITRNSPFANGPAFNAKTGERYSMVGGLRFGINQPIPTPSPIVFATNTPSATQTAVPVDDLTLIDLMSTLSITNFTYYSPSGMNLGNIQNALVNLSTDNRQAYTTLAAFLDPEGIYKDAWWFDDQKVTPDEVLATLVFHEGQVNEAVQTAIFARYLFYMGGANFMGPAPDGDIDVAASRLIRFLNYFQPWKEHDKVEFNSPVASGHALNVAQSFLQNPDNFIPGASTWNAELLDPTQTGSFADGQPGWGMVDQDTINGQPVIQNVDGEWVATVDWANTPWHFVTEGPAGLPTEMISDKLRDASIGPNADQVSARIDVGGGKYTFVFTPAQAAYFCITDADGFSLLEPDCRK